MLQGAAQPQGSIWVVKGRSCRCFENLQGSGEDCVKAQVGMSFVLDHSGRVFTDKKCSLKDLVSNGDVPWIADDNSSDVCLCLEPPRTL